MGKKSGKHEPGQHAAGSTRGIRTGDGRTSGTKPTRAAITQRGNNGGILRAITKKLWR